MLFSKKKKNENEIQAESEMSFLDHIDALRGHLFRAALYISIVMFVLFLQKAFIFDTVLLGPLNKDFVTYRFFCNLSDITCFDPGVVEVYTRELSEQLTIHLKVAFFMAMIVTFPLIFNEVWKFVKPGLYQKEITATRGVIIGCTLLFYIGILFGYFIISPFSISFLASYNVSDRIKNTVTLDSYVDSMTMFTLSTGAVFELPVVVFFLAKLGIMGPEFMRTYRRHAIVVIAILAAVITPPDVTSMIMVLLPMLILYEFSIYIAKRNYPKEV